MLFPAPVRVAHTAITGFGLASIVERGPRRQKSAPAARVRDAWVHHVFVGKVRVGEDDLVDAFLADDVLELVLGPDGDAFGVPCAGQCRRIARGRRCPVSAPR